MQTAKEKNSSTIEPMEADLYNNNITNSNSVRKRRATEEQQSDVSVKKQALNMMA